MATAFATDLARWGPHRAYDAPPAPAARAYCRRLAETHYENFSVASMFVPRRLLRHFHNVYAYCRWSDDLADETTQGTTALQLLAWWRDELRACYDGTPRHPVFVALRETIQQFDIPPEPFLALLSAFEQDQRVKEYTTFEELCDYCRRSADPVGRLVLYLGQCHDETRGRLSDSICTGLQLANFWQDVARDLDLGRVYLPREDRERFHYPDSDLHAKCMTPAFRDLLRFEVARTRSLFEEGLPLVPMMPRDLRIQIELFAQGGLAILRKIEQQNFDVWTARPKLSKLDKARLMARVVARRAGVPL
ncbi:MAG: squalene synthase HpnC [Gemmataceae bacterium]|nr:squalene synthase HpnC [Gemmataceae bacterium]